ncbi:fimbrial chaperone protein [Hydrogenophaga palleronii]|uniref:Fimbrial chaperone protein n=1 Tax=Hydrogenophaga palleronii TaxID=65655 RepID=A0ABU1WR23_9BURK|nr:fimbria/pilus periplasmic chaperone [Hydrogenophaga palleronii]MDR7151477.1 fimbrial chaperone protein [Hydrogenophaga palleronii]
MRLQLTKSAVACLGRSVLAGLGLWGAAAHGLTISPVLVELSSARRVASITITNPGDRPLSFQTQVRGWSQPNGTDVYADTTQLFVAPPIAEIAAGGSQIFRVTTRNRPSADEQAYRLIFEDVSEVFASSVPTGETSISIRVNHDLPVFLAAAGTLRLQSRLGPCANATTLPATTGCVRLDNEGSRYLRVKSLTLESGNWRKDFNVATRVLAGAWREWTFEQPTQLTGSLRVRAETSDGPVTFEWPIPPR